MTAELPIAFFTFPVLCRLLDRRSVLYRLLGRRSVLHRLLGRRSALYHRRSALYRLLDRRSALCRLLGRRSILRRLLGWCSRAGLSGHAVQSVQSVICPFPEKRTPLCSGHLRAVKGIASLRVLHLCKLFLPASARPAGRFHDCEDDQAEHDQEGEGLDNSQNEVSPEFHEI